MTRTTDDDTALGLALKKAQDKKDEERKAKRDARRQQTQDRLEMLQAKSAQEPKPKKPAPQRPAWDGDVEVSTPQLQAIAKKIGAPGTEERREHMRRIGQIARDRKSGDLTEAERKERMGRIARGESPSAPPSPPQRYVEPKATPPAPHDPRLLNGTLVPSERVAEHIKLSEAAPQPKPVVERPLQESSFPVGWAEILENGSPTAILATRQYSQLNDDEKAAYHRAKGRYMEAITAEAGVRHRPRRPRMALDLMSPLGRTITTLRLERAWTLAELSKASSVPVAFVSKMLNKRADSVPDDYLAKLASAFGIDVRDLTHPAKPKVRGNRDMTPPERLAFLMGRAHLGVAALCRLAGLSPSTVQAALKGTRPMSTWTAKKLAPILKTYPAKLMSIPTTTEATPEPQLEDEIAEAAAPAPESEAEEPTVSTLGANIRRLAQSMGLSDRKVGQKAGLWPSVVHDIRHRPGRTPSHATLVKLATALDTTVEGLLGEQPEPASVPGSSMVVIADTAYGEIVEAEAVTFLPRIEIEKGVPAPSSFKLRHEMYRFDELVKGDSIVAEVPYGIEWGVFYNRFSVMVANAQHRTQHLYHYEAAHDRSHIRLWRML